MECDESFSEQNPSSVRTEGSASDGPLSVTSSLYNETSNDSVKYDEHDEYSHSIKPRTYGRTVSSDNATSDVIDDASNDVNENENDESARHEEYSYPVTQRRPRTRENFPTDVIDDVSTDVTENENDDNDESDNYDENYDESTYEAADDAGDDGLGYQQGTLSAKNHLLGQDGQLVVLWTR
jgi:hypothetical protein